MLFPIRLLWYSCIDIESGEIFTGLPNNICFILGKIITHNFYSICDTNVNQFVQEHELIWNYCQSQTLSSLWWSSWPCAHWCLLAFDTLTTYLLLVRRTVMIHTPAYLISKWLVPLVLVSSPWWIPSYFWFSSFSTYDLARLMFLPDTDPGLVDNPLIFPLPAWMTTVVDSTLACSWLRFMWFPVLHLLVLH